MNNGMIARPLFSSHVTVWQSLMGYIHAPRPNTSARPDLPAAPPIVPPVSPSCAAPVAPSTTDASDPMAGYHELEARVRADAARRADETPGDRRAMAVAEAAFPGMPYSRRRTLVRAIVAMGESPYMTDVERAVRAAYYSTAGDVVEVSAELEPGPTAVDAVARELAAGRLGVELPGLAPHGYRAIVTRTLQAVREHAPLSPHQTRIHHSYRKAVSELGAGAIGGRA